MTATTVQGESSAGQRPGSDRGRRPRSGPGRRGSRPGTGAAIYRPWWMPVLWVAPSVILTLVFGLFPFINTVVLSFTDARPLGGGGDWVGFANYTDLLTDENFWLATRNSVVYAIVAVPLLVLLPLMLAQLVYRHIWGIGFFRTAFYTPVIASVVAVALVWQNLFSDRGPINSFLKVFGLTEPIPFLSEPALILLSAILLTVWKGLGWYMIFYLAALAQIPPELYEAAEIDGAGPVRRFFHITVPSVRLTMLLIAIMSGIGSLRVFTEVYILGGPTGGPGGEARTLPFYIRDTALDPIAGNAGYGAAVSVALFVLTIGLAIASQKLGGEDEE